MIDKKYPLEKIHDIRKLRVDAARAYLLEKKRDVIKADKELSAKQDELISHEIRVRALLDVKYKRIAENEITYKLWNDFRDIKEWMRFEHIKIMDEIKHVQKKLKTAQINEKKAFEEYRKREMNVIKLDEHRNIWMEAMHKESKRIEDDGDDA